MIRKKEVETNKMTRMRCVFIEHIMGTFLSSQHASPVSVSVTMSISSLPGEKNHIMTINVAINMIISITI